ncbi:hypothetical protein BDF21DRAFT_348553 [Thamnidium elegans]|nr:hypothetical protein BDF21DRAFT_348553 [Thamnidium elegans]
MADCCIILVTILCPPVGVFLMFGCGADLCINICLTVLGYLPGHIHAFYLMFTRYQRPSQQYVSYQPPPQAYN